MKGGIKLSKLFRISGYFRQDESWQCEKPTFIGEVIMDQLPIFWGCCKEFGDGDTIRANATSFLAGAFTKRPEIGLYFYKMYDNPPQDMLLCIIKDLKNCGRGIWATPEKSGGRFIERNIAQLDIEELPYSEELAQEIYSTFVNGCPPLVGFPERLAEETAKLLKK